MLLRWSVLTSLVVLFQGCATPPPVQESFTGPTAIIADTATGGGRGSGGVFFTVTKLDGKAVANSLGASRQASFGRGMDLRVSQMERRVLAGKVRLELLGRVAYAAPIQEIFSSLRNRLYSVSGTIEVELKPDVRYRVNGVLDELRQEVWIEEEASRRVVGQKIVGEPSAEAVKAAAAESAFTCCNLHYDPDGWISDANWATLSFIPAGTPVKVYEYGRNRAKVMIDGAPMWLGLDYGREQQSIQQLVAKLSVKDDPKLQLATYPLAVQRAIHAGKVMAGMTKEQVVMSLGYPRMDTTRSLDLPKWSYRTFDDEEYFVLWGADGLVQGIDADAKVRRIVVQGE